MKKDAAIARRDRVTPFGVKPVIFVCLHRSSVTIRFAEAPNHAVGNGPDCFGWGVRVFGDKRPPAKLLPSNNSIFPDGVIGGSICAESGMGTAANRSAIAGKKNNFIGIFMLLAFGATPGGKLAEGGIRARIHHFPKAYYSKKPSIQAKSLTIRENGCETKFFFHAVNDRASLRAACSLSLDFQKSSKRRLL